MSKRSIFGRNKSIERRIDELLDKVSECAMVVVATLDHQLDAGQDDSVLRRIEQLMELKRACSQLRREIESELYSEMLIPDLLGDVASLIESLHQLVELVREDRHILAVILGGSLSHDQVWEKSDIDLVLIRTDEKKGKERTALALTVDGVNIHAWIWSRDQFRKAIEGKTRNSFEHSFFAKARL